MSLETVGNTIRARFRDRVAVPLGIPVVYDNGPQAHPADSRWIRLAIKFGDARLVQNPLLYRTVGITFAMIFSPVKTGDREALDIVDAIDVEFRSLRDGEVTFKTPSPRVIGRTEDGKWWQVNMRCPFHYDRLVTA